MNLQLSLFDTPVAVPDVPSVAAAPRQASLFEAVAPDATSPAHDQVLARGQLPAAIAGLVYGLPANQQRRLLEDYSQGRITGPAAMRAAIRRISK